MTPVVKCDLENYMRFLSMQLQAFAGQLLPSGKS